MSRSSGNSLSLLTRMVLPRELTFCCCTAPMKYAIISMFSSSSSPELLSPASVLCSAILYESSVQIQVAQATDAIRCHGRTCQKAHQCARIAKKYQQYKDTRHPIKLKKGVKTPQQQQHTHHIMCDGAHVVSVACNQSLSLLRRRYVKIMRRCMRCTYYAA